MPRRPRAGRRCYCDLHVTRGELIPYHRWVEHQDRLRAEQLLLQNEEVLLAEPVPAPEIDTDHESHDLQGEGDLAASCCAPSEGRQSFSTDDSNSSDERSSRRSDVPGNIESEFDSEDSEECGSSNYSNESVLETVNRFSSFDLLDDVADWTIEDDNLLYSIKSIIWKTEFRVSNAAFQNRPMHQAVESIGQTSLYRLKKDLRQLTGLTTARIPCCFNNCAAFCDESIRECQYCESQIYEQVDLASGTITRARKTFFYFSPLQRLLFEYATPSSAKEMEEYMDFVLNSSTNFSLVSDFWTSQHFQNIRNTYFRDKRTLALTLTTDGVQNVRQKSSSVWPIVITILNYPPELRARHMMIVGMIPGPREPKDFASYFETLLADLQVLSTTGIRAYDGYRKETFQLKAHVCIVTGDTPAIAKLMAMKGSNAISPCRFCSIKGQSNGRHWYYPRDGHLLQYRQDLRREAIMVSAANNEELRKTHGITGLSFLFSIQTLHFPNSFGLDCMHLFSNVAKMMWNLWTGCLLPEPIFENSADNYLLSKVQQAEIGIEMASSRQCVPVSVSRTPRDISRHKNSFKATEWFQWVTIYSCPLLVERLPEYALRSWQLFVAGVRIALKTKLSSQEIAKMDRFFQQFTDTTESIYYQGIRENLAICTSQLHGLLHVGTTIRALGPAFVSWQFGLERFAGQIEPLTTSKSQLNVSLYNGLELQEHVRYVKSLYKIETRLPANPRATKDLRNSAGVIIGHFIGPVKNKSLSPAHHHLLRSFYSTLDNQVCDTSDSILTQDYRNWSKLVRQIAFGTAHDFAITSNTSRTQTGRDRCCCMFMNNELGGISFGRVIAFIEHCHQEAIHDLAIIRVFNVVEEDNSGALYYVDELYSMVIKVVAILEPIGLIERVHEIQLRSSSRQIRRQKRFWIARSSGIEMAME